MAVLVLDKRKKPLMPCSEKRARLLLERGRAVVHRMRPFTIRLKDRTVEESVLQPIRIKLDPGSKATGIAVIREDDFNPDQQQVLMLMLMEIEHRGQRIKDALTRRRALRRRRRGPLRHRAPRFDNRTRSRGWLAPSLQHRVDTTLAWVNRLCRSAPVTGITMDAACVGTVTAVTGWNVPTLTMRATGRGSYQRTRLDRFGFPRGYLMRQKQVEGFQTGDLVRAEVPTGKKAGTYQGRVAIRATGRFNIQTREGVVQGISHRHCRLLQRADGYGYAFQPKPIREDATRAA